MTDEQKTKHWASVIEAVDRTDDIDEKAVLLQAAIAKLGPVPDEFKVAVYKAVPLHDPARS